MPDNRNDPGPLDGKLISLTEPHEVAYWTEALGVTRARLVGIIEAVGPSAAAVREYLAGQPDEADPQGEG